MGTPSTGTAHPRIVSPEISFASSLELAHAWTAQLPEEDCCVGTGARVLMSSLGSLIPPNEGLHQTTPFSPPSPLPKGKYSRTCVGCSLSGPSQMSFSPVLGPVPCLGGPAPTPANCVPLSAFTGGFSLASREPWPQLVGKEARGPGISLLGSPSSAQLP